MDGSERKHKKFRCKKKSVCLGVFNKMLRSTSGYTEGAAPLIKLVSYFKIDLGFVLLLLLSYLISNSMCPFSFNLKRVQIVSTCLCVCLFPFIALSLSLFFFFLFFVLKVTQNKN